MQQSVTFIVIAKNESKFIASCIESIIKINICKKQIILVDSNSNDDTPKIMFDYASKQKHISFISTKKRGAASARNCGLKQAKNEYIFFIDGDVKIHEAFLKSAFEEFTANADTCALAGQLAEITYDMSYEIRLKSNNDRYNRTRRKEVFSFGGIFIVRKAISDEIGPWDERFICHEDTDYAIRLSALGKIIAIPVPMGLHNTVDYEKRMLNLVRSGYFINIGALIRKHLLKPFVIIKLILKLRLLFPFYLLCLVTILAFTVKLNLLYLNAPIIIFDMLACLLIRKSLRSRFLAHYVVPFQVILGFVGYSNR